MDEDQAEGRYDSEAGDQAARRASRRGGDGGLGQ